MADIAVWGGHRGTITGCIKLLKYIYIHIEMLLLIEMQMARADKTLSNEQSFVVSVIWVFGLKEELSNIERGNYFRLFFFSFSYRKRGSWKWRGFLRAHITRQSASPINIHAAKEGKMKHTHTEAQHAMCSFVFYLCSFSHHFSSGIPLSPAECIFN